MKLLTKLKQTENGKMTYIIPYRRGLCLILGFSQDMYFYSSLVNKSIRAAYGQAKNKKLAKFPCPHKKGVLHLAHIHSL